MEMDPNGRNPTEDFKGFSDDQSDGDPDFFEFSLEKPIVTAKPNLWKAQKRSADGRFQSQNISPRDP
jgi:hypothetical protein